MDTYHTRAYGGKKRGRHITTYKKTALNIAILYTWHVKTEINQHKHDHHRLPPTTRMPADDMPQ